MAKERGLIQMIFKEFVKSLTPKASKKECVGKDYYGTKYYEISGRNSEYAHKKTSRYFVPVNKDDFEQEIPAEWEAWLRNRRKVPPTEDEVLASYELMMIKKKNAAEIEATHAKTTTAVEVVDPYAKPLSQHASLNFPVYEEYREFGRRYKPKIKKDE